jgi:hypothetical protein
MLGDKRQGWRGAGVLDGSTPEAGDLANSHHRTASEDEAGHYGRGGAGMGAWGWSEAAAMAWRTSRIPQIGIGADPGNQHVGGRSRAGFMPMAGR